MVDFPPPQRHWKWIMAAGAMSLNKNEDWLNKMNELESTEWEIANLPHGSENHFVY
jgi:hypothetical protein